LPYGRPAAAEPLGELPVAQLLAGGEGAVDDRLAERAEHVVAEQGAAGARSIGGDGHRLILRTLCRGARHVLTARSPACNISHAARVTASDTRTTTGARAPEKGTDHEHHPPDDRPGARSLRRVGELERGRPAPAAGRPP